MTNNKGERSRSSINILNILHKGDISKECQWSTNHSFETVAHWITTIDNTNWGNGKRWFLLVKDQSSIINSSFSVFLFLFSYLLKHLKSFVLDTIVCITINWHVEVYEKSFSPAYSRTKTFNFHWSNDTFVAFPLAFMLFTNFRSHYCSRSIWFIKFMLTNFHYFTNNTFLSRILFYFLTNVMPPTANVTNWSEQCMNPRWTKIKSFESVAFLFNVRSN